MSSSGEIGRSRTIGKGGSSSEPRSRRSRYRRVAAIVQGARLLPIVLRQADGGVLDALGGRDVPVPARPPMGVHGALAASLAVRASARPRSGRAEARDRGGAPLVRGPVRAPRRPDGRGDVIQRFGSALNLNVIAVDGVYAPDETGELLFRSAPHPTTGDVEALIERIATRCEARPPLAKSRLVALENGRVALVLRRPWSDGTTERCSRARSSWSGWRRWCRRGRATRCCTMGCSRPGRS
jgi:hypothetical protein